MFDAAVAYSVTVRAGKRAYRRDIFYCTGFVPFSHNALILWLQIEQLERMT